jgi:hypothetical protein
MHPYKSFSLVVAFISGHVRSSMGLTSARSPRLVDTAASSTIGAVDTFGAVSNQLWEQPAANGGRSYAVLAHHKHASTLMFQLAKIVKGPLEISAHLITWQQVQRNEASPVAAVEPDCQAMNIYLDMRLPLLKHILEKCPGIRAVHMIRQPSEVVVSEYVYTKHVLPFQEAVPDLKWGAKLRNMSIADGLEGECGRFFYAYSPQALAVHQYIRSNAEHLPNILEVDADDFKDDFDGTSRKIFAHWVGAGHPLLDSMVSKASYWDIGRYPTHVAGSWNHVSSVDEKAQAFQVMETQSELGSSCMSRLKKLDELWGYHTHE